MSWNTAQIQRDDSAHYLHPFTDTAALAKTGARVMVKAEGIFVWDSEGNKILDAMSGLWCVNMGYGQQSLVDAATRQMETLPFYNSFFNTTVVPAVDLARNLSEVTPPGFTRAFFTNSGSEANDTMIRLVRHFWSLQNKPEKQFIIARKNGYHGSTIGGASLGGMSDMHKQGGLPIQGIAHIGQPYHYACGTDETPEAFGLRAASWLEDNILEIGADKVGAFVGEPVQGAGGVIIPPPGYWQEIERICRKYDVLLVSDEVICGFGRLGAWFGCQYFGYTPDLILFAKGVTSGYLPLGGVMLGARVGDALVAGGDFNHGFTYSGHPVSCAVALANLKLMHEHKIVNKVATDTAPYFHQKFMSLADHPLVSITETCGMVAGLVLVQDKATRAPFASDRSVGMVCRRHCFASGVIMRAVGDRMIIAPPLVMSHAEIDLMIALIRQSLDATAKEMAQ